MRVFVQKYKFICKMRFFASKKKAPQTNCSAPFILTSYILLYRISIFNNLLWKQI